MQGVEIRIEPGLSFVELYGAQGGIGCQNSHLIQLPGKGAYVSGYIYHQRPTSYYLYVGGFGQNGSKISNTTALGGWNGGGNGGPDTNDDDGSGGGGGATDLRTVYHEDPLNSKSLLSRIMVAAGAGGGAFNCQGSPGGDDTGYTVPVRIDCAVGGAIYEKSIKTTQTDGNALGKGGNGLGHKYTPGSGGGGGYYGGVSRVSTDEKVPPSTADSGSSYINKALFTNTNMIAGGNTIRENGFARITLVKSIDFSLNKAKIKKLYPYLFWLYSMILDAKSMQY